MAAIQIFEPEAKGRVAGLVAAIEAGTSAEIVVRLSAHSGHYRHTDYLVGLAVAALALVVFLFHPAPFPIAPFPLFFGVAFAMGTLLSAWLPPLRRALTREALLADNVRLAARAAFVDDRVSVTRGRTGILVYVSVFERRVEIVHDVGVDEAALGEGYRRAREALETVLRSSLDADAFGAALARLGPPLAEALPRAVDDENELPDEARS